jgi:tetratricopeptide (TPR) repeat protein
VALAAAACQQVRRDEASAEGERAIAEATRRIEADPDDADAWVERADLYRLEQRFTEMRNDAERALALDSRHPRALGLRGMGKAVAGENDLALADFDRALAIKPDIALIWGLRGNVLLKEGKCPEAIESFDRAIAIEPIAAAYFDRAACRYEAGEIRRALDDYDEALRLNPDLLPARLERGHVRQQLGDVRGALEDLEWCRARLPRDPQVAISLAWILATAPDGAVRDGARALEIAGKVCDPMTCDVSAPLNALAAARAEMGEFAEAETLLRHAVALSPFDKDLRERSSRRLETVRRREPIRDAATILALAPRIEISLPRNVNVEDFLDAPADVVALDLLNTKTLLTTCSIAAAGATINGAIDGLELTITRDNARQVEVRLEERRRACAAAIRQRGFAELSPGYQATVKGACDAWGFGPGPVLVEQDGAEIFLSQGAVRHMGVVVESAVALLHDMNTTLRITGQFADGAIVFTTPRRGGIDGLAEDRCRWTLEPRPVKGDSWADAFAGRALAHRSYGKDREAIDDLVRALGFRDDVEIASLKAFILATSDDASVRDGRRALEEAKRAVARSEGEPRMHALMALAAAYAETGDFKRAVEWQKRIVALCAEDEKPEQEERLRGFESGKPCRIRSGT